MKFNNKEFDFLKILSQAIPHWGRYPIPKRWEITHKEEIIQGGIREMFLKIWDKIGFKIYELTKDGWKGPNGPKKPERFLGKRMGHCVSLWLAPDEVF